jgi:hypothetical protein
MQLSTLTSTANFRARISLIHLHAVTTEGLGTGRCANSMVLNRGYHMCTKRHFDEIEASLGTFNKLTLKNL